MPAVPLIPVLAAFLCFLFGQAVYAVEPLAPIVIKFSHVVAPNTPKGKAADYFKKLAETRSNGRVKVEVYPNSQLYKDREEIEALQLGAVQMLAPSLSKFGPLGVRQFELFDLPYIFPNKETLYQVMDGEIGRRLLELLKEKQIVGLAYWDNGFKHMSANRPLRQVADFNGLKMRIQPSKVLEAQMKALGASPQVMAFSEVRAALEHNVVDGTENPFSNVFTQKMHEVQKHLTVSQHGYLGYVVIVNKPFWDGLPSDLRTVLEKAMRDATLYERRIAEEENEAALAAIRQAGTTEVYVLGLQDRIKWWQAVLPVHQAFESQIGAELIQSVYRVAKSVEAKKKP
mgnify:CR=1 FL=1